MMRKSMIAAVAVLGLSVSACQTTDVGTTVGGLLGAAGGGLAANKFIGKGQGKKLATVGGVLGGGLLGGLFGKSMTMPYDNRQNIQNNSVQIDQNGRRIYQNTQNIDVNRERLNVNQARLNEQSGKPRYNYDGTPIIINNGSGAENRANQVQNNPYNCQVVNNYVRCNSN